MALPIRRRCSSLNINNADRQGLKVDPKDNPIIADAPPKGILTCELHHIAGERIGLHGAERRHDARLVSGGNAL